MTSKPTSLILRRLVRDKDLVLRRSTREIYGERREIYVTPEIASLLDGANPALGFPKVEAESVISRFLAGWNVLVSTKMNVKAELEWLEGVDDVWALCLRRPRPGWRILGRFESKNTFIGLHAFDRHQLSTVKTYTEKANLIPDEWTALFGAVEPLRGTKVSDYLSIPFGVIGDE